MVTKRIDVAAREMKRLITSAVGKSFLKTMTEPLTNSDTALKKLAGISHAAGLVDLMFQLKSGARVDTSTLKEEIKKTHKRKIKVQLFPTRMGGTESRFCRIVDSGPGMTEIQLLKNFGTYAEAKAMGENTRSLFGRGALDALLYHDDSTIFSVADGMLSECKIYIDEKSKHPTCSVEPLGKVSKSLLESHDLPAEILSSGTVVQFRLKEGTHIPQEDQIIAKMSAFYMLRLIAADPNCEVSVERKRVSGYFSNLLQYNFPVGVVLGRFSDVLDLGKEGKLGIDILVARSDQPLQTDPMNIERRENGLLFVDENDAVMDLTLLPEYDKDPFLEHLFGVVRITGVRSVLERKLEEDEPVAVLSVSRDGFSRRAEITQKLFGMVEKHVKPIYEKESRQQKKGTVPRSDELSKRVKDVLKVINSFINEETDTPGLNPPPPPGRSDAIYFAEQTVRLIAGNTRRVHVFVNLEKVKLGEIVLFESDNPQIRVEPDSEVVQQRKGKFQKFDLRLTCSLKGQKGIITALTLNKDGVDVSASIKILDVTDPPVFQPPDDIEFRPTQFSGQPNKSNSAVLFVNLDAFTGKPEITFWLEKKVGNISLDEVGAERIHIKVKQDQVIEGTNVARISVPFKGTGWGQHAVLNAKAKRKDGEFARSDCKLRFEAAPGNDKFSNFHYENLNRPVLGDVAGDKLYVNAGYSLHREIFGETEADFNKMLETDATAQRRAASVIVQVAVYNTATEKYIAGGRKGLDLGDDPITNLRGYIEEHTMELEPRVMRALAPSISRFSS